MIVYTLYYYDRPFLEAFLNHYCHIPCVNEIIIQDQNWSTEDTLYLLETVARYIDDFGVKISVLPSQFKRVDGASKRAQFFKVGQPTIRNRVLQFLSCRPFITGAPDEAIYGESYADTNKKLEEFESAALVRAQHGENSAGFMQLISVVRNDFHPETNWKNRVSFFVTPFAYTGAPAHDMQISVFRDGRWHKDTPSSGHYVHLDFRRLGDIQLDLKTLHYQPLFRPNTESAEFMKISREHITNWNDHPQHYISKLVAR